jgi:phosphoribosylformylglycinamidine synthase
LYLAKVFVTLKPTVNDPQGLTVLGGLKTLGFSSVESVRVGKYLEIKINESELSKAESLVSEMCRSLLANPVIEEFSFHLEELATV